MNSSSRPVEMTRNDDGKIRFSMSPAAMGGLLGMLFTMFSGWALFMQENATKGDLVAHNTSDVAHAKAFQIVMLDKDGHPKPPEDMRRVVKKHDRVLEEFEGVKKNVGDLSVAITGLGVAANKREAREFANRAVDKLPQSIPRTKFATIYEQVKTAAFNNLQNGRSIQTGLERYTF